MKKCRKNAGFTMVELMTVVAILTILMGLVVVNVLKYQRDLKGKESDSAAREIFIAAQNHLTAASALGELTTTDVNGNQVLISTGLGTSQGNNDYLLVGPSSGNLLDKILPFGAIDEHVRSGGSYIIRYNLKTATVLDVFYSDTSDSRFGETLEASGEGNFIYTALSELKDTESASKKEQRRNYHGKVVGWYGGANVGDLGSYDDYLKEPTIKVINADTLQVEIKPLAAKTGALKEGASLSLIVTGVSSGAMKEIKLVCDDIWVNDTDVIRDKIMSEDNLTLLKYQVTLDDITVSERKFANAMKNTTVGGKSVVDFLPGEDLDIRAVAFDNNNLSNIAESGTVRVNSLFGSLEKEGGTDPADTTKTVPDTVTISSFRHLENLDSTISSLNWDVLATEQGKKAIASADRIRAKQETDLDWTTFLRNTSGTYLYKPVIPRKHTATGDASIPLIYDAGEVKKGNSETERVLVSHSIRNLTVSTTGANAGLFDTLPADSTKNYSSSVSNLDLVNFNVTAAGSYSEGGETVSARSGALAGKAEAAVLTNVKVYNDLSDDSALSITGSGSVGGLVGDFTGSANGCAAAVYVKSTSGSAGGLFGTATAAGTTVISNSYSGGHTVSGKYKVNSSQVKNGDKVIGYTYTAESADKTAGRLNVMGATAGGLIGTLNSGTVSNCYTTCSVGGSSTVGGFVGSATSGSTDENCYCTGLVAKLEESSYIPFKKSDGFGVFAGSSSVTLNGKYLDIINYFSTKITGDSGNQKAENAEATDQIAIVGDQSSADGITAIDGSADSYNGFADYSSSPTDTRKTVAAVPYDSGLLSKAKKAENIPQYGLKHVSFTYTYYEKVAGTELPTPNSITIDVSHYGDWPIYETLVVNT